MDIFGLLTQTAYQIEVAGGYVRFIAFARCSEAIADFF